MTQNKSNSDNLNIASIDVPPPVTSAKRHALYPQMQHDERARLNFIMACYRMTANVLTPGNEQVYKARVKPAFEQKNKRPPENRQEVRQAMNHDRFHSMWCALRRNLMEIRHHAG